MVDIAGHYTSLLDVVSATNVHAKIFISCVLRQGRRSVAVLCKGASIQRGLAGGVLGPGSGVP